MPVLYAGFDADGIAGPEYYGFMSPFPIQSAPRHANQNLSAALVGFVYVPVVSASRLESYVAYRNPRVARGAR